MTRSNGRLEKVNGRLEKANGRLEKANGRLEKALLGTKDTSQLTAFMNRVMPLLKIKFWRAQEEEA